MAASSASTPRGEEAAENGTSSSVAQSPSITTRSQRRTSVRQEAINNSATVSSASVASASPVKTTGPAGPEVPEEPENNSLQEEDDIEMDIQPVDDVVETSPAAAKAELETDTVPEEDGGIDIQEEDEPMDDGEGVLAEEDEEEEDEGMEVDEVAEEEDDGEGGEGSELEGDESAVFHDAENGDGEDIGDEDEEDEEEDEEGEGDEGEEGGADGDEDVGGDDDEDDDSSVLTEDDDIDLSANSPATFNAHAASLVKKEPYLADPTKLLGTVSQEYVVDPSMVASTSVNGEASAAAKPTDGSAIPGTPPPKEKKTRKKRVASPSPTPPPPPKPMETVRLDIPFFSLTDKYIFNARSLSVAAGFIDDVDIGIDNGNLKRAIDLKKKGKEKEKAENSAASLNGSAAPGAPLTEDEEAKRIAAEMEAKYGGGVASLDGKPARKKRRVLPEQYDDTDPFVDDSELYVDEPQYAGVPKQAGFFVHHGVVPLAAGELVGANASKAKKQAVTAATASSGAPLMRKTSTTNTLMSKPKKRIAPTTLTPTSMLHGYPSVLASAASGSEDIQLLGDRSSATPGRGSAPPGFHTTPGGSLILSHVQRDPRVFSDVLETALVNLKTEVQSELFEGSDKFPKGKFPERLKPILVDTTKLAIERGEYGEEYFDRMPGIFPYNRYTMMKLIKKETYDWQLVRLQHIQAQNIVRFGQEVAAVTQRQIDDHERSVVLWRESQAAKSVNPQPPVEESPASAGGKKTGPNPDEPPPKKFRFSDEMKSALWDCSITSTEIITLQNDLSNLTKPANGPAPVLITEQSARRTLYAELVKFFPEGYMTTGLIGRTVSELKTKQQKQEQRAAAQFEAQLE